MLNRLYIFTTALIVAIIDQISKYAISKELFVGQKVIVIDNYLSFLKVYNTGAAFNLLNKNTHMLANFSLIVTILIVIYFLVRPVLLPQILIWAWGLILGGTIGNMIDRISFGFVIDFIKLDFVNFPVFNLADVAINVGALLIIIHVLRKTSHSLS